jgi:hypothetical protein
LLIAGAWGAGIAAFAWWLLKAKQADRNVSFAADPVPADSVLRAEQRSRIEKSDRFFDIAFLEKVVLISLLSIIFAQVIPDIKSSNMQIAIGVAILIIINTILSHWLSRRGKDWKSISQEFVIMTLVNFGLVLAFDFLLPRFDGSINLGNALFFVLLLTLNVTLYDRYYQIYMYRKEGSG